MPSTHYCVSCETAFIRKRKDQRYCSRHCQKGATQNASRGSQRSADSVTSRLQAERLRGRAWLLTDELYKVPPVDRPTFMETIRHSAKTDWHLRRILTDQRNIRDLTTDYAGRPNLTRSMDDYCRLTRRARIWEVVADNWCEPNSIRPLALYRDCWVHPDDEKEVDIQQYVPQHTATFLSNLKALRAAQPSSSSIYGDHLPDLMTAA